VALGCRRMAAAAVFPGTAQTSRPRQRTQPPPAGHRDRRATLQRTSLTPDVGLRHTKMHVWQWPMRQLR